MICAGPLVSRRVLHNRGLTVVTVPADTDCTIRLETPVAGWRTADPGVEELTGRDCRRGHRFRQAGARRRSPRITTRVRNRGALAPGLMRIG